MINEKKNDAAETADNLDPAEQQEASVEGNVEAPTEQKPRRVREPIDAIVWSKKNRKVPRIEDQE